MYIWTNDEIEKILIQLDEQENPFETYSFTRKKGKLQLLGRGGTALVYEAQTRGGRCGYAIKVIGFGEKYVNSELFESSVRVQKNTGLFQKNIVKIYDYAERLVWIDEEDCVIRVQKTEEESCETNCLRLQFILMEKLEPVLLRDKSGKVELMPDSLAKGGEKEFLKFAYDIGTALSLAHKQNILHRDVKLENIFYDAKRKHYKLGDFGIARMTDDGMASTVAFTKGYGAPEVVGGLEDLYDNTADIYSFGMLLYVVLNGLKFPDSDSYNVNSKMQYKPGFVLTRPVKGSDALWTAIEKMCRYDPDERYQSMDEVLDDLEKQIFHAHTHYQREHKEASYAAGALLLFLGTIVWKLTCRSELVIELPPITYLFLALSIGKWVLKLSKRNVIFISIIIFVTGVYLIASFGFSWGKLLLLLGITFSSGNFAGLSAGVILTANFAYLAAEQNQEMLKSYQDYRWGAVALLSLAAVMILQYFVLQERDHILTSIYLKKDKYWIMVFLLYAVFFLYGLWIHGKTADMCSGFFGERLTGELLSYDLEKAGGIGMGVSIAWIIREKILINREEHRKNNGSTRRFKTKEKRLWDYLTKRLVPDVGRK